MSPVPTLPRSRTDLRPSRLEGLFVGGSSGTALSGALRFLHSEAGQAVANDPEANVVIILPDGVRNYMSKPWFLDVEADKSAEALRSHIRGVLGRDLNDPGSVVEQSSEEELVPAKAMQGASSNGRPTRMETEDETPAVLSMLRESTAIQVPTVDNDVLAA